MAADIKVLIIDSEDRTVKMMKNLLESYGYQVFSVNSGIDAIRLFDEFKPHIVLLETMLTDMPGEDIFTFIRSRFMIPILVLSSKDDEESILNAFNSGADDYIVKPFSMLHLTARINNLLKRYNREVNQNIV